MFSWPDGDEEVEFFKRRELQGNKAALFEADGEEEAVGFQ